eukprot:Rhum_TRINITY_DN511_c0_g1::Rhum_TRINITY_DN511_c0_g1_i1::g.1640::m.1640
MLRFRLALAVLWVAGAVCDVRLFGDVFRGQCQAPHDTQQTDLKLYWYRLPAEFNTEMMEYWNMKSRTHRYYCDIGCAVCDTWGWGRRGSDMAVRQMGGGLALLAKLSLLSTVDNPEEADFFIVPALNYLIFNSGWGWLTGLNESKQLRLFDYLRHYNRRTAARHVFIAADEPSSHLAIRSQPLVIHMGPRIPQPYVPADVGEAGCLPGRPHHIVVPDPQMTQLTQPGSYSHNREREVFVFYFGSMPDHIPVRRRALEEVAQYQAFDTVEQEEQFVSKRGGVPLSAAERRKRQYNVSLNIIHPVKDKRKWVHRHIALQKGKGMLQPREMHRLFNSSKFCLVLSGDIPHQTRFFEAILHGCLPVVVSYSGGRSWWRDAEHPERTSHFSRTASNYPGDVLDSYPFTEYIPYRDFVVVVPETTFVAEGLMPTLTQMPPEEYKRRVREMLRHRSKLTYDFTSTAEDAFSLVLRSLSDVSSALQKAECRQSNENCLDGVPGLVPCPLLQNGSQPRSHQMLRHLWDRDTAVRPFLPEPFLPKWVAPSSVDSESRADTDVDTSVMRAVPVTKAGTLLLVAVLVLRVRAWKRNSCNA